MRIALVLNRAPRTSRFNGDIIRNGCIGVSGTEQTFVIVAEQLAKQGHKVMLWGENMTNGETVNNVQYSDRREDLSDTEVLITIPWITFLHELHMPMLKTIIINMQCIGIHNNLKNYISKKMNSVKTISVYPSQWAKDAHETSEFKTDLFSDNHFVIYNPLMTDVLNMIQEVPKVPKSLIFTATWERGGHMANRVIDKLKKQDNAYSLMVFDYYPGSRTSGNKKTIFENLSKCEYFVYPLVLPTGMVHKDTFACCVAEALALDVIVLTYPIAALKDLYADMAVFIDLPINHNNALLTHSFSSDRALLKEECVDAFVQKINELENNPDLKCEIKRKSRDAVRTMCNDHSIGMKWHDLINNSCL